jgi:hypothetical protein
VPLRGPPWPAVVRRGPPSAVARRPPCLALYVLLYIKRLRAVCICYAMP